MNFNHEILTLFCRFRSQLLINFVVKFINAKKFISSSPEGPCTFIDSFLVGIALSIDIEEL